MKKHYVEKIAEMAYKTDMERAALILTTLCPRKVVIHTPQHCDCSELINTFKSEGYNVLHMNSDVNTKKFNRVWNNDDPVMIHGSLTPEQVYAIPGYFSLIYVYPNSEKSYAAQIMKNSQVSKTDLRDVVASCMLTHKQHYQSYCDKFDNKVFTVLI